MTTSADSQSSNGDSHSGKCPTIRWIAAQQTALEHELASLSSIIRMLNDLLETRGSELTDAQRASVVSHIRECSLQLGELIRRNWIAGNTAPDRSLHSGEVNLRKLCENIIDQLRLTRPDASRIQFIAGATQVLSVGVDPNLARSIVMNLLINALKYSPPDESVLLVIDADHRNAIIQVADRGIGIAPEDISQVFEPKYRASGVESIDGSGMGLYIVKRACELMRGSITVESTLGLGTIFTVRLPA